MATPPPNPVTSAMPNVSMQNRNDIAVERIRQQFGLGPSTVTDPNATQYNSVYMGNDNNGEAVIFTKEEAKQQLLLGTGDSQQALAQLMQIKYGKNWRKRSVDPLLNDIVDSAAFQHGKYGKKVTPLNATVEAMQSWNELIGGPGGGGGGGAAGPTKAVNLTDPGTAKTLLNQALDSYLGKKATPKEVDTFMKALNVQEMKNPTQVSTQNGMTVRSGGFNPATFAEDYAAGMEGAGEYQAATTFLDTFIGSLNNPVRL